LILRGFRHNFEKVQKNFNVFILINIGCKSINKVYVCAIVLFMQLSECCSIIFNLCACFCANNGSMRNARGMQQGSIVHLFHSEFTEE